jgi:copper transport protein
VILAVVSLWRFTPPPRALLAATAAAASASVDVDLADEKAMAMLSIEPGRVGTSAVGIELMTAEGAPLEAKAVRLVLSSPEGSIEPIARDAVPAGPASWRVERLVLPLAGTWTVRVEILISDFEEMRLEGTVEIAP